MVHTEDQSAPLRASLTQIFRDIKHTNMLNQPRPPASQPRTADPSKWCEFHQSIGHYTNHCYTLRKEIQRLVSEGHLARYVQTEPQAVNADRGQNPTLDKDGLPPSKGEMLTVSGDFTLMGEVNGVHAENLVPKYRQPYKHPPIVFTDADFEGVEPHMDDPVVVTLRIHGYDMHRVLLDQGSSADIIYGDTFERMGLTRSDPKPYYGSLSGFTDEEVDVRGYVEVETIFGRGPYIKRVMVHYLVLPCNATYNVILGRHTLNDIGGVVSTPHLKMKYPTDDGKVGVICVNQETAKRCKAENEVKFAKSSKSKGKRHMAAHVSHGLLPLQASPVLDVDQDYALDPRDHAVLDRTQPTEVTKKVAIGDRNLLIGSSMQADDEKKLIDLLGRNLDLFAWTIQDVPGIDPNFICHKLALDKGVRPVVQPRRKLNAEKTEAVRIEVDKLLKAKFIREIQYPTWLANVVMV